MLAIAKFETRDERDKRFEELRARGARHLTRYSDPVQNESGWSQAYFVVWEAEDDSLTTVAL